MKTEATATETAASETTAAASQSASRAPAANKASTKKASKKAEKSATKKTAKSATKKAAKRAPVKKTAKANDGVPREFSKKAIVLDLLRRKEGATMAEIANATNWQNHSIRGFISGQLTKKMGLTVESGKNEAGDRVYRIASK